MQCFGKQASARATQLLAGRSVWIEYDASQDRRDRYGRDLVYVWLDDHSMFNDVMVSEGYAHEYTYDAPYRYQQQFRQAQAADETGQRGLWNPSTCAGDTEQPAASASTAPQPDVTPSVSMPSAAGVYYSSCAAVRAAGRAPLLRGQSGYRSKLDGDRDGVACESG